jgi:hypothetical protein
MSACHQALLTALKEPVQKAFLDDMARHAVSCAAQLDHPGESLASVQQHFETALRHRLIAYDLAIAAIEKLWHDDTSGKAST